MSNLYYKFGHLVNNKLTKIYVFMGEQNEDMNLLFKTEPTNPLFAGIFSEEELGSEEDKIVFVAHAIHKDDTIETIKKNYCSN